MQPSFYFYANPFQARGADAALALAGAVRRRGGEVFTDPWLAKQGVGNACSLANLPDDLQALVAFGGDGTLLRTVQETLGRDLPLLGVNTGTVGFLMNGRANDPEGTAEKLKAYCAERGVGCDVIPPVLLDGRVVSSTYIRTLVEAGDMEQARRYLGHPHTLLDTVHSGYRLGTKMGAPTINMRFPDGVLVPRHGVYAAQVYLEDGSEHIAVTNVGVRPTVSESERVTVESHLLRYSGNLYGRQARLDFYGFLRPEQKFVNYEELSAQIRKDAQAAGAWFEKQS